MESLEFKTRVGYNGEIIMPEHIKRKAKRGALASVTIFDEGVTEFGGEIINMGKTYRDRRKFWDEYEFEGVWNGE